MDILYNAFLLYMFQRGGIRGDVRTPDDKKKTPLSKKLPFYIRNHIAQYDQDIMWPNNVPISIHKELVDMSLHNETFYLQELIFLWYTQ